MDNKEDLTSIISNITITPKSVDILQQLLENYLKNGKDNFTLYVKNSDRKGNDPLNIYPLLSEALDIAAHNEPNVTKDILSLIEGQDKYGFILKGDARTRIKDLGRLFDKVYHKIANRIKNIHPEVDNMIDVNVCLRYPDLANEYLDEVIHGINDSFRYTITLPTEEYVDGLNDFIKKMDDMGYHVCNYKNKWQENDSCKGIFLVFERDSIVEGIPGILGNRFEVQVHTRQNYVYKEKSRVAYEVYRNPLADPFYRELGGKMRKYYHGTQIIVPEGAVEWSYPIKNKKI